MVCKRLHSVLVIITLSLLLVFPALALDPAEIASKEEKPDPLLNVPDFTQLQSKATWSPEDWLKYGDELSHEASSAEAHNKMEVFESFTGPDLSVVRMNALKAYNMGLKDAEPNAIDETTRDLWAGKASVYKEMGANELALEATEKAIQASPVTQKKTDLMAEKAQILKALGRLEEANAVQQEAEKLSESISRKTGESPVHPLVIAAGVCMAVLFFVRRKNIPVRA